MPQINIEPFSLDLYNKFVGLLESKDEEALEIYENLYALLEKRWDEDLALGHDLEDDISPEEYHKLHDQRM